MKNYYLGLYEKSMPNTLTLEEKLRQAKAAGFDFDLTFGLMHTAEKSAEILVKTLSMQPTKRQTITPDEFRHLAKDFGVTLPEEFLYEK